MTQHDLLDELAALPDDARRQVADFIALLRQRHDTERTVPPHERSGFEEEPFIGMWREREDLTDSSAWIRGTRQAEWDRTGR